MSAVLYFDARGIEGRLGSLCEALSKNAVLVLYALLRQDRLLADEKYPLVRPALRECRAGTIQTPAARSIVRRVEASRLPIRSRQVLSWYHTHCKFARIPASERILSPFESLSANVVLVPYTPVQRDRILASERCHLVRAALRECLASTRNARAPRWNLCQ